MTRFQHSILFFFALASALLCSAALMLFLDRLWAEPAFGPLVISAFLVAVLVPAAAGLASLKFLQWRQPLMAWLIFCLVAVGIAAIIGIQLL